MPYYVYILTNYKQTVLYTGFTGNLVERVFQHKTGKVKGFTEKYKTNILIYYEQFKDIHEAKAREQAIKKWNRGWKEQLISQSNTEWVEIFIV